MGEIESLIARAIDAPQSQGFSAAQVVVIRGGEVICSLARGETARFDGPLCQPVASTNRTPVSKDSLFDIASLTKLFTAAALLELLAASKLGVDTPAHRFLPEMESGRRSGVTIRHLLTHTAGYPPMWGGWKDGLENDQALKAIREIPLEVAPGERHAYSCVGYILAGAVAEAMASTSLDTIVREVITSPLGLTATRFQPADSRMTVATEFQLFPTPGVTRGHVHDETARALGGVAGNAGLFSTAIDLAAFAEEIRTGSRGVLSSETRHAMTTVQTPAGVTSEFGQAMGPRIADNTNFGVLADGGVGHTGFTGTRLLVHPELELSIVALTNRVHPSRTTIAPSLFRRELAELARS